MISMTYEVLLKGALPSKGSYAPETRRILPFYETNLGDGLTFGGQQVCSLFNYGEGVVLKNAHFINTLETDLFDECGEVVGKASATRKTWVASGIG